VSALRPCGHVLSDRALAQVKADAVCLLCSAPFTPERVVPPNGPKEQVERRREMLRVARRRKSNKGKKAKRSKARARGQRGGRGRFAARATRGAGSGAGRRGYEADYGGG